jgi:hypothetical protein
MTANPSVSRVSGVDNRRPGYINTFDCRSWSQRMKTVDGCDSLGITTFTSKPIEF